MSRPPTINDFKSYSDLKEAIDEFKRYSDRSTSFYERTVTCFHEIVESVPADKPETVNVLSITPTFLFIYNRRSVKFENARITVERVEICQVGSGYKSRL